VRLRSHGWLVRRLALGALTLFLVSVVVFVATQALPSDPAQAVLGRGAQPEQLAAMRAELGLDRPLVTQYLDWLGGAVTLHMGHSLSATNTSVMHLIGHRLENSAVLLLITGVLLVVLSVAAGVLCALFRDRPVDHAAQGVALVANAVPEFVVGTLLVVVFSTVVFEWLPAVSLASDQSPLSQPSTLVLPVATLLIATVPYLMRHVRGSMLDVLRSHYVEMARLKGIDERRVLLRHVLPNALVPAIQGTAATLAYLAGGIVVVETLFNYPGLGSELTSAMAVRDLPVIQACVLFLAGVYVVLNLVADILTVLVTPRLRTALQ
jgi:peptide/nickel transport system permease protein